MAPNKNDYAQWQRKLDEWVLDKEGANGILLRRRLTSYPVSVTTGLTGAIVAKTSAVASASGVQQGQKGNLFHHYAREKNDFIGGKRKAKNPAGGAPAAKAAKGGGGSNDAMKVPGSVTYDNKGRPRWFCQFHDKRCRHHPSSCSQNPANYGKPEEELKRLQEAAVKAAKKAAPKQATPPAEK